MVLLFVLLYVCVVSYTERLSKTAMDNKWNCVKLRCIQPYTTGRQFGLKFVRLTSSTACEEQSCTSPQSVVNGSRSSLYQFSSPPLRSPGLSSSSLTPTHSSTASRDFPGTPKMVRGVRYPVSRRPVLPTLSSNKGRRETDASPLTPKHTLRSPKNDDKEEEADDSQEFEFAGVENQSRLLKGTISGDKDLIGDNGLLGRIASERGRSAEQEDKSPGYSRRKLLHKGLARASKSVNITHSYSTQSGNKAFGSLSYLGKNH